ncbi:cupin domain-containing protein (plasmid) [Paroceanicella profunda]|uniref:Cupin domain-containing protein n=1 Tax=Paroceanicella profunda TaxID=2579971 RepID=A0A5B8G2L2_9RHOB|nr:cupin domain-containing protein [Paroceanicella profunda]QDL94314.1 cupin domain-containing protein [Paroceanicella profunda]
MKLDLNATTGADTIWVVGDRIRFLGGLPAANSELIEVDVPPGSGTPPHCHASAEMFYILSGELTVRDFPDAGQPPSVVVAKPGDAVTIASGRAHNYSNEGERPVKMLVLIEPSMIAFFREAGTAEPQAEPDLARLGAAMQRHGIDLIGMAA